MTSSQSSPSSTAVASRGESSALVSSQGKTTIADTVVSKIAGIATRDVDGVHAVGGGTARAVGALRERIPGARTPGRVCCRVWADDRGCAGGVGRVRGGHRHCSIRIARARRARCSCPRTTVGVVCRICAISA